MDRRIPPKTVEERQPEAGKEEEPAPSKDGGKQIPEEPTDDTGAHLLNPGQFTVPATSPIAGLPNPLPAQFNAPASAATPETVTKEASDDGGTSPEETDDAEEESEDELTITEGGGFGSEDDESSSNDGPQLTVGSGSGLFNPPGEQVEEDDGAGGTLDVNLNPDREPVDPGDRLPVGGEPGEGGEAGDADSPAPADESDSETESSDGDLSFALPEAAADSEISAEDGSSGSEDDGLDSELVFTVPAETADAVVSSGGEGTDAPGDDSEEAPEAPEDPDGGSAGGDVDSGDVAEPISEPGPAEDPDDGSAGGDLETDDVTPIDFSTEKDVQKEEIDEKPKEVPVEKETDEDSAKLDTLFQQPPDDAAALIVAEFPDDYFADDTEPSKDGDDEFDDGP